MARWPDSKDPEGGATGTAWRRLGGGLTGIVRFLLLSFALVAFLVAQLLDAIARTVILHHLGLDGRPSPVSSGLTLDLEPIIDSVVVFALADAFRRGRALVEDTAGLV